MTSNTTAGRLFRLLVRAYPAWVGGRDELGPYYHKASSRIGDTIEPAGFEVDRRRRAGRTHEEYRFKDAETHARAELLVTSWLTGRPVEELAASQAGSQAALRLGG